MVNKLIVEDFGAVESSASPMPLGHHEPLGELLLTARNAKKLTQKNVADNLRISIKQINALETNDFALLPDAMTTRGFIRNYARLLDVDAEPLIASYRTRMPNVIPSIVSVPTSKYKAMKNKGNKPWLKFILSGILLVILLLSWLFYKNFKPQLLIAAPTTVPFMPIVTTVNKTVEFPEYDAQELALPEAALPAAERESAENIEPATVNNSSDNNGSVMNDKVVNDKVVNPSTANDEVSSSQVARLNME